MDVTQQINRSMIGTGGGSSNPAYFSVNRSLNYARGSNSLLNARQENVTAIPFSTNYKDTVGLFGAENIFLKIQLNIQNTLNQENGIVVAKYTEAFLDPERDNSDLYWGDNVVDFLVDKNTVNTYDPALISNAGLNFVPNALVKVDLLNLKTGNQYVDVWFDTRLYTPDRQPYEYDTMFIPPNGCFYIGFHARNTKRLPYNVSMTVGNRLYSESELTSKERRYLVS